MFPAAYVELTDCPAQQQEDQGAVVYKALYAYKDSDPTHLHFAAGEEILVYEHDEVNAWWRGAIGARSGVFPALYVALPDDSTHAALEALKAKKKSAYYDPLLPMYDQSPANTPLSGTTPVPARRPAPVANQQQQQQQQQQLAAAAAGAVLSPTPRRKAPVATAQARNVVATAAAAPPAAAAKESDYSPIVLPAAKESDYSAVTIAAPTAPVESRERLTSAAARLPPPSRAAPRLNTNADANVNTKDITAPTDETGFYNNMHDPVNKDDDAAATSSSSDDDEEAPQPSRLDMRAQLQHQLQQALATQQRQPQQQQQPGIDSVQLRRGHPQGRKAAPPPPSSTTGKGALAAEDEVAAILEPPPVPPPDTSSVRRKPPPAPPGAKPAPPQKPAASKPAPPAPPPPPVKPSRSHAHIPLGPPPPGPAPVSPAVVAEPFAPPAAAAVPEEKKEKAAVPSMPAAKPAVEPERKVALRPPQQAQAKPVPPTKPEPQPQTPTAATPAPAPTPTPTPTPPAAKPKPVLALKPLLPTGRSATVSASDLAARPLASNGHAKPLLGSILAEAETEPAESPVKPAAVPRAEAEAGSQNADHPPKPQRHKPVPHPEVSAPAAVDAPPVTEAKQASAVAIPQAEPAPTVEAAGRRMSVGRMEPVRAAPTLPSQAPGGEQIPHIESFALPRVCGPSSEFFF